MTTPNTLRSVSLWKLHLPPLYVMFSHALCLQLYLQAELYTPRPVGYRLCHSWWEHFADHSSQQATLSGSHRWVSGRIVSHNSDNQTKNISLNITELALKNVLSVFSYLFPDGRTQNPDLTGLCEPSPQDHIKVTQVLHSSPSMPCVKAKIQSCSVFQPLGHFSFM